MSCRSSFSPEVTCSTCLWVIFFLKWWGVHLQVKYYIHMEWSLSVFSLAEQQMEDRMEWMMNKLTTRRSCYSVWVRMMMRRMTTTTAQTAPIMIIFLSSSLIIASVPLTTRLWELVRPARPAQPPLLSPFSFVLWSGTLQLFWSVP